MSVRKMEWLRSWLHSLIALGRTCHGSIGLGGAAVNGSFRRVQVRRDIQRTKRRSRARSTPQIRIASLGSANISGACIPAPSPSQGEGWGEGRDAQVCNRLHRVTDAAIDCSSRPSPGLVPRGLGHPLPGKERGQGPGKFGRPLRSRPDDLESRPTGDVDPARRLSRISSVDRPPTRVNRLHPCSTIAASPTRRLLRCPCVRCCRAAPRPARPATSGPPRAPR